MTGNSFVQQIEASQNLTGTVEKSMEETYTPEMCHASDRLYTADG